MRILISLLFACAVCVGAFAATSLTDGAGRSIAFDTPPARVVALSPSTTEIVCALGARDRLVGRTRYAHFPPDVETLPDVGGAYDPDYERILALKPDLVILTNTADTRIAARFEALGLRVLILHKESLAHVRDDIALVGAALGEQAAALRETRRLDDALARRAAVLKQRGARKVRTLFMYGARGDFLCAGKGSFAGELLTAAGAENLAEAARVPWPQLGREAVLRAAPELVLRVVEGLTGEICAPAPDADTLARWRADPVLRHLPATESGHIYRLDARLFNYPGPRLSAALAQLSALVDAYFASEASDFLGNSNDAPTAEPNSAATTPSDHSISR